MEFHVSRDVRRKYDVDEVLFNYAGNLVFGNIAASRKLAKNINEARAREGGSAATVHAGALFAMGLIDELNHAMVARYRQTLDPAVLPEALRWLESKGNAIEVDKLLRKFTEQFPNVSIYRGEKTITEWLRESTQDMPNREAALEELLMLWLANINPAFTPFKEFFDDQSLQQQTIYKNVTTEFKDYFATRPQIAPEIGSLLDALKAPMLASPDSLGGQLDYIRENWAEHLGPDLRKILLAIDILREEDIAIWMRFHPPSTHSRHGHDLGGWGAEGFLGDQFVGFGIGAGGRQLGQPLHEYEAFSPDQAWMPTVVLIAKSTYVWLEQLSKKYQRHIHRLDQIPDEEMGLLASRGLNGLWLIGLWERSTASQTIKRLRGQADAVASAYSLKDYRIAEDLGGPAAYEHLRNRAAAAGIRLASDMVPNHMGIDSTWVMEHPEWFLSRHDSPFPAYQFQGPDLSTDSRFEIRIEDHYYEETDAAVVFQLRDRRNGRTEYVYHGNDGTTFAWNDTAQLNYSRADVREHVIQTILNVARQFPIIRFDAAMTLAKKHVQRLWFPLPGVGGSIPSRSESAMSQEEFDALMPNEFWREVVDRVAVEVPGTLLLAEAFWLLEGYFVRTLGMHRVYNSAFMNMLRDEENAKYRSYLKKTIEFDPDILKRYVNFMSNPDERTAIDQFGTGDKYFGTCTLLATLPGLPMFGHGQIEAFAEKYGMEYKRARFDEYPDEDLVRRHQREIAPLLKRRYLFAESSNFVMYDFWGEDGKVNENVFAYSNRCGDERALVLYNNSYSSTRGTIHASAESMDKGSGQLRQRSLTEALHLPSTDSIILAYKDTATNLIYLRRSKAFDHSGFSIDLRGYQYVVLQYWIELQSSAEYPWDRLCDALHGEGVYNLEEALTKLRLRPLHEALWAVLSPSMIRGYVDFAEEHLTPAKSGVKDITAIPQDTSAGEKVAGKNAKLEQAKKPSAQGKTQDATPSKDGAPATKDIVDPRIDALTERAVAFFEAVWKSDEQVIVPHRRESAAGQKPGAQEVEFESRFKSAAIAAASVSRLKQEFGYQWPESVRPLLPGGHTENRQKTVLGPILAWILLSRFLPEIEGIDALFDPLQLRSALAQSFAQIGIVGEDLWRAAARVQALLSLQSHQSAMAALQSPDFWRNPDVRWLAGVSEAFGTTYINKELFEELLWWLELPGLIEKVEKGTTHPEMFLEIEGRVISASDAAQEAGYELDKLLVLLPVALRQHVHFTTRQKRDSMLRSVPTRDADGKASEVQVESSEASNRNR